MAAERQAGGSAPLAPAFPRELGMHRAPSGWKSKAKLLPGEETLPTPWALLLLPRQPREPCGWGSAPSMGEVPRRGSPASGLAFPPCPLPLLLPK